MTTSPNFTDELSIDTLAPESRNRVSVAVEKAYQCIGEPLNCGALIDPVRLVEKLGVSLQFAEFDNEDQDIRGFAALGASHRPEIYINALLDEGTQMFTLVHEIGHVLMHQKEIADASIALGEEVVALQTAVSERRCDLEADAFAREILMPEKVVRPLAQAHVSANDLARALLVPPQHAAWRLRELSDG